MNKKYMAGAVLFVLAAALFCGIAWFHSYNQKNATDWRGRFVFADSKNKINYLGRINISNSENGEINIHRDKDGNWRFAEAKDYYVNEDMLSAFFKLIKSSYIVSEYRSDEKLRKKGTEIKIFDLDGQLLDDVTLGKLTTSDMMWAYKGNNENNLYNITYEGGFSASPRDWLPYPLLSIKTAEIKSVTINGKERDYPAFNKLLSNSSAWRNFARVLNFVDYQGLTLKSDLTTLPPDVRIRQIDVLMLTGMFYKIMVMKVGNSYWMLVSMDAKKVFTKDAVNVAVNTYRFYADWIFQLMDEQGKVLFDDALLD